MAKKKKVVKHVGTCIRCNINETMENSGLCEKCSQIKCKRSVCDTTHCVHQHIHNHDWYCIKCAIAINEACDQFKEGRCFDIF